eukprot:CAMPEP_0169065404 /NCGR_PEP_ID=MMETSP1015-20121227/2385_1 /TAXON_ID=342587 /ORGANISM="Karlodinium micrum, Strain CCMP2283" /LENGTH=292 /DNA_ID=CAMNT_0009123975 /DNA_START=74 /DNA_END=952 /DNA_ORIENTATION=-
MRISGLSSAALLVVAYSITWRCSASARIKRKVQRLNVTAPIVDCDPNNQNVNGPVRRVVFYGGTFDPPTTAHLHVARVALREADCVWLSAVAHPDYKPGKADIKLRYEMLSYSFGRDAGVMKVTGAYENSYNEAVAKNDTEGMKLQRMDITAYGWLSRNYPNTHFDWLVGADSLTPGGPYTEEGWRDILRAVASKQGRILVLSRGSAETTGYEKGLCDKWDVNPSVFVHLGDVDMRAYSDVSSSRIREIMKQAVNGGGITPLRQDLTTAGLPPALLDYLEGKPAVAIKYIGG